MDSRRLRVVRRFFTATVCLVLVLGATAASQPDAKTVASHRLVVVVAKTLAPAAEKKLAVLVLITQNGGPPAGALATPGKPLTVLLDNRGTYRVRAEIDSCSGTCAASSRISGSAHHKLEVVTSCRSTGPRFVCSRVRILRIH